MADEKQTVKVSIHPDVSAWCKWISSPEGKGCMEPGPTGKYLENRLWRAFNAGIAYLRDKTRREL